MTSAKERAVEAGARAASPYAFNDAFWLAKGAPDHHQKHAQANALRHAEAVLCAASPIMADEVMDAAAAYLRDTYGASYGLDHPVDRERIRARIQQMAEAL
ncbi:hypothetical protein [Kaistia sp. UC242_56]|uniref:hypothetical protein n=1 Tax=Kaistia sp. UC242_56 TaxID=3374625 RepID=UPI00379C4C37